MSEERKQVTDILESREKMVDELFKMFDKNGNGLIEASELEHLLYSMGRKADRKEIEEFLRECDKDMDDKITRREFDEMLEKFYCYPQEKVEEVVDAFKIFDLNKNKKISLSELKTILLKYSNDFTEEECEELFKIIDTDGSGEISYEEFVEKWKFQ